MLFKSDFCMLKCQTRSPTNWKWDAGSLAVRKKLVATRKEATEVRIIRVSDVQLIVQLIAHVLSDKPYSSWSGSDSRDSFAQKSRNPNYQESTKK